MGIWNEFETKWKQEKRSAGNTEDTTKGNEKEIETHT